VDKASQQLKQMIKDFNEKGYKYDFNLYVNDKNIDFVKSIFTNTSQAYQYICDTAERCGDYIFFDGVFEEDADLAFGIQMSTKIYEALLLVNPELNLGCYDIIGYNWSPENESPFANWRGN